jgi:hypothetical protein
MSRLKQPTAAAAEDAFDGDAEGLSDTLEDAAEAPEPAQSTATAVEASGGAEPEPESEEDPFALAVRARKEGRTSTAPTIKRRPTAIKVVTRVKPWFRVHPQGVYEGLDIFIDPNNEDIEKRPHYVMPDVVDELAGVDGLRKYTGYLIVTINGTTQLLLVPEPDESGELNPASEEKHEACKQAVTEWTRLVWQKEERQYQVMTAEWPNRKPKWPDDVSELSVFRRAFKKLLVEDLDHPLVKMALGEEDA